MHPEILQQARDYLKNAAAIKLVDFEAGTGKLGLQDLKDKLSHATAAVYLENPNYFGCIEESAREIADLTHNCGALFVVSVDPISLGIMETPANYGADIVCGDIQPLGMHMFYGGGCAGFIATSGENRYVAQYPTYLYGIAPTMRENEYGWGRALNYRTSHGSRENANEYFGTGTGLWAITAASYLALMGPKGMEELGETIIYRSNYARKMLSRIKGLKTDVFHSSILKTGRIEELLPTGMRREKSPQLPEISQMQVLRHFLRLSQETLGTDICIDIGLGTCTMKYSPKINEQFVRSSKMSEIHPYQDESTVQGILKIMYKLGEYLQEISGMDRFSLQPSSGTQAIYANASVVRAYHDAAGEGERRNEVITTIFSHPGNPGAAATAGYKVITLMPDENGYPDLDALKSVVSGRTAALFITNPEDTGIFNPRIKEYIDIVHEAGGALCLRSG